MIIRAAKPSDAAGIARVHVESWRTTYPGIMPQEHLDALSVADRELFWQGLLRGEGSAETLVYVAQADNGEIVGFVSGGAEHGTNAQQVGRIDALYLLRAYQGQGLGRRLVQTIARRFYGDGCRALFLWVNIHNPARRFYEALGGVATRTGRREIKGVTYDDIGYGWDEAAFARLLGERSL